MKFPHIISLGVRCWPKQFIDCYKIRPRYKVRMPFDGCYYEYNAMVDCLRTDFKDYLSNLKEFHECKHTPHPYYRRHHPVDDSVLAYWNHESKFDLDQLTDRSNQRIAQFIEVLSRPDEPILFFYFKDSTNAHPGMTELIEVLNEKYPKLKYHIFAMSFGKTEQFHTKENCSEYVSASPHGKTFHEAVTPYNNITLAKMCKILEEDPSQYVGNVVKHFGMQE